MYHPSTQYKRTPEERRDQHLSWNRPDKAFFAAGACHILAYAFLETYPDAGFHPVGLWPRGARDPAHIYVTNNTWAFDHDGWTPHPELLAATPNSEFTPAQIHINLETFCTRHNHRPRHLFAYDPWPRALHYLTKFPPPAP
ncbi:hypothetical protein GCM10022254_01910 [Actinomadura meridiana]|uniref:Uncharacterized protein n=1 Tax=Actinomadura meridiana TaxID=559626 RepID=A0ABP8BRK9_9ACTN